MINKHQVILLIIVTQSILSCAPKLTFTEVQERVNRNYIAFNENDVEYEYANTPVKYLKEYGKEGFREKLEKIAESRSENKYPVVYDDIGSLRIQEISKCNSTYFYKVEYVVDKAQITPYLDSIALERNFKRYGQKNVSFNPNSKILQIRLEQESILIYDKDNHWKMLNYNLNNNKLFDRLFGEGFSKCMHLKVENSEYLPYW